MSWWKRFSKGTGTFILWAKAGTEKKREEAVPSWGRPCLFRTVAEARGSFHARGQEAVIGWPLEEVQSKNGGKQERLHDFQVPEQNEKVGTLLKIIKNFKMMTA